ncbi:hypothetical protein MTR62_09935 [Novosphingobium sp. 1949]|uniref:Uncharacterized protein n=1 Tax=Novosphingobium organovorum TaxID=2930092 RepID=A0ABT0BD84_9SPHN|nr:hypothetical protein [Novosphingobium organovorum]MCJ2183011.1 hypothetical protein [Novosphingobium organovorum]
MNLPFIDTIWTVRGSLALIPPRTSAETFAALDDQFQADGTRTAIDGDTLTFRKKDPRAQDKMAIYRSGTLTVEQGQTTSRLVYAMNSGTLLFCFALPFFFVAVALLLKDAKTSGLVFAGIFAALYIAGRILEPWLIRKAFTKRLNGEAEAPDTAPVAARDPGAPLQQSAHHA